MTPIIIDTSEIVGFRDFLAQFPKQTGRAMSIAINDTMKKVVLPRGREMMREQVRFPDSYLNRPDRFGIDTYATPTSLYGQVAGRDDPTSLKRFADPYIQNMSRGDKWVPVQNVEVHPGVVKNVGLSTRGKMYIIPLKRGTDWGNAGLAIRLRKGERVENIREYNPVEIHPNVFILYGPSVDQIFKSVAVDLMPEVTSFMNQEFYRQMDRLLGGVNFGIT